MSLPMWRNVKEYPMKFSCQKSETWISKATSTYSKYKGWRSKLNYKAKEVNSHIQNVGHFIKQLTLVSITSQWYEGTKGGKLL